MGNASPEILLGLMIVLGLTALGLTIWLLRFVLRAQSKKKPAETPTSPSVEEDLGEQTSAVIPDAPVEPISAAPTSAEPREVPSAAPTLRVQQREPEPGDAELMRVWQDRDGTLMLEVDGQRYRRLFDIRDGEVGRRVLDIIDRLVAFSKGQQSYLAPPALSEPTPNVLQGAVPPPVIVPPSPDAIIEDPAQDLIEQLREPKAKPKKSQFSMDPVPFRPRSVAKDHAITLNLAEEIDQLLQIHVRAAPEFSQRYIHVTRAPDGGLRFQVDDLCYIGLDEIPDQGVQELIRLAIAEWEARR